MKNENIDDAFARYSYYDKDGNLLDTFITLREDSYGAQKVSFGEVRYMTVRQPHKAPKDFIIPY